jgi:rod shape-determining protein MreD
MIDIAGLSLQRKAGLNAGVILLSVMGCALLMLTRWPGMELLAIGPNWLMMWLVAWSVKRSIWQGAFAGLILGLIQDSLSGSSNPSHVVSLVVVGVATALLQKQRYIQEELVSIALMAFGMSMLNETITAGQYLIEHHNSAISASGNSPIWLRYQQVALASAILSSLWMPVLYYPLNWWWQKINSSGEKLPS